MEPARQLHLLSTSPLWKSRWAVSASPSQQHQLSLLTTGECVRACNLVGGRADGCQGCLQVTPGEPQVGVGRGGEAVAEARSFTFDNVYEDSDPLLPAEGHFFQERVKPLVGGLLSGLNATVRVPCLPLPSPSLSASLTPTHPGI